MVKEINKLRLSYLGKRIFFNEYFRIFKNTGLRSANRFVKMIYNAIKNERLIEHDHKAVVHFFMPPIPSQSFATHLRTYADSLILKKRIQHLGDVLISTTRKCPYNCWYCSAINTPHGEISIENIKQIISILKEWGTSTIGFTGGEPLLRTDTDEIIRQYSDELTFIIFTSGHGLNPLRTKKLKECGLFYIAISLIYLLCYRSYNAYNHIYRKTLRFPSACRVVNSFRLANKLLNWVRMWLSGEKPLIWQYKPALRRRKGGCL